MIVLPRSSCRLIPASLALLAAVALSCAAGSPNAFRTLVVVNTNSTDSVELGAYYAAAHAIPAHHVCRLGIAPNLVSLTSNEFQTLLVSPITNHIAINGLSGQIDFLVLCQDFPTRVRNVEGVSASLFYGFKNAPGYNQGGIGCNLPAYTSNAYFRAEQAFRSTDGWNATNGFIAFHLIASNLPTAKLVVDRGAAAQSSFPSSAIYLHMLGDAARGVREQLFDNTQFSFTALPGLPTSCMIAPLYSNMSGKTNVIGYQDGYGGIPAVVRTNNVWLPGAYADHLTSCGGMIPDPCYNQSSVLDWMQIGATASYGTVAEPCNYLAKFPDPLMGFYYARGFTIGEAYAMSVFAPYQGLFAGDPLAAPFAAPPEITVTSHTPYQIVTGTIPIQVSATARSNGVPAASLDLYLDSRFHTNLVVLGPTLSNILSVAVGNRTNSATMATNQTLSAAVISLATAVNADSGQIVSATARGDRLELIYKNFDHAGDNIPVSASVSQGTAAARTLGVGFAATNLVPSIYPARENVQLSGTANSNDTLTCIITLTNGVAVTNILVAAQGETAANLLERLRTAIHADATLMATNGVRYDRLASSANTFGAFFARTPGPDGAGIQLDYFVTAVTNTSGLKTNVNFSSLFDDNANDTRPRASLLFHVRPTNGILSATATVDTTTLADGLHTLDFIARDGSAVATAARLSHPLIICNTSAWFSALGTNGVIVSNSAPPATSAGTDFSLVAMGDSQTNIFSLYNHGLVPVSITNWGLQGSHSNQFFIPKIPPVIEAGGISNFMIVFSPPTNGIYDATVFFESDTLLPLTNLLIRGSGACSLNILTAHRIPSFRVGRQLYDFNIILTNSITAPTPIRGTQFVCTGWTMTGNIPSTGSTTNFVMTLTNHAELTWLWTTNYWLKSAAGPNGSVNLADSWQPANVSTQITALPDTYYAFTNWSGDASGTNNPLDLLMDAPKSIHASFIARLATNSTPQWWLAQHGWTNDFDDAATNDADTDGFFTWQEYIADTDPTNGASYLLPLSATGRVESLVIGFDPTSTQRHYWVDSTELIELPNWDSVTNAPGNGGAWLPAIIPPATGLYFYRGRVTLPSP